MAAAAHGPVPKPRPAVRSRRRRRGVVALLLVALLLLGRGLGWSGTAEQGAAPLTPEAPPVDRAVDSVSSPLPESPGPTPAASPVAVAPAGPLAETRGALAATPGAAGGTATTPAFDADRFASRLSLLDSAIADGRLGLALQSLAQMRTLPLDGSQQAALLLPARQLSEQIAACCSRIVADLARGEVLVGHDGLGLLVADGDAAMAPFLDAALRVAGVAGQLVGGRRAAESPVPIAQPLARGRELRVRWRGSLHAGRVVDSRSEEVTVRIATAAGVAFPTVPVVDCQPIAPTGAEAVEMGFAALQADDVLLARAWLVCSRLRPPSASTGRLAQLASLLP